MKKIFTFLILLISVCSKAQTVCGTVNEGGSVNLTAPPGYIITNIVFASYGTPNGSCGSFTIGGCHAANSVSVCATVFVGLNSASISATNGVFGDPCGGTPKRLYIEAAYSTILPLTLTSFTAKKQEEGKVRLNWTSDHETNTANFVIERSTDGILFESTGTVPATGNGGGSYSFTDNIAGIVPTYYYRLKMVDLDGKFQYSNIVRIDNDKDGLKLSVFPSPANEFITILSSKQQEAMITNSTGQVFSKLSLINGNQTVNIASWSPGLYFIKTEERTIRFLKN